MPKINVVTIFKAVNYQYFLIFALTSLLSLHVSITEGKPHGPPAVAQPHSPLSPDPSTTSIASGKTSGFELSHGYSFNAAATPDGEPYTSGWGYIGGRAGPGPTYLKDNTGFLPTDLWSGRDVDLISGGLYLMSGIIGLSSLYYTLSPLIHSSANKNPTSSPTGDAPSKKSDKEDEKDVSKKEAKSRQRRAVSVVNQVDSNDDLVRLADVVSTAISYGECLQNTICEAAHGLGFPNGRRPFTHRDAMLHFENSDEIDHKNMFFLTMKKALEDEKLDCDEFKCAPKIMETWF